jgi:signal transduction histidine kinase
MNLSPFFDWFSGGSQPYMRLADCMNHDYFWVGLTVALDLAVACGYMMIAAHWWRNCRTMPDTPARSALNNMRNIFAFCGLCGYVFIPIKMIWPAWRLYDLFMLALVYWTWRYAWNARDLKVIYSELGRSTKLAQDLDKIREESRQKSLFLNSLSHDLRTPLNGLVLQTALARMAAQKGDLAMTQNALDEIEGGTRATAELLDRLLEYARANAMDERNCVRTFNLRHLAEQVCKTHHALAAGKKLELLIKIPGDLSLNSDAVKLERILTNLVNNAIKFTPSGSITLDVERSEAGVELQVIDTGIGIAEVDQGKLFQEFFQAGNAERDRSKGFGLGLAIARRLALQLGGDLTVDSAPGRGARFTVLLPRASVPAPVSGAGNARPELVASS